MGEGRLPQTAAKRSMIDPQKQGARTALPRRSAHMPGKPQRIAQRATMPDRRPPPPHTALAKTSPRPLGFKLPPRAQKHRSIQLKNQERNEIKPVLKTICSAGPRRAIAGKSRNEPN